MQRKYALNTRDTPKIYNFFSALVNLYNHTRFNIVSIHFKWFGGYLYLEMIQI
eukprot:UN03812